MTEEKPLNVRVAEVIGWSGIEHGNLMDLSRPHNGYPPSLPIVGQKQRIPPYGEDSPEGWACTGPLMIKYGINLIRPGMWLATENDPTQWDEGVLGWREDLCATAASDNPMEAVCNLILALAEAGKLRKGE